MKRIFKFVGKRIALKLLPPPMRIAVGISGFVLTHLYKRRKKSRA